MRFPGVQDKEAGLFTRFVFWISRRRFGRVLDPLRVYAYHPRLLKAFGRIVRALQGSKAVSPRLKGLAMQRTAVRVGCPF